MRLSDPTRGRLSSAEQQVLARLVDEMAPRLLAYVRRAFGHPQDAEDIVAETFQRAASNLASLQATPRPDLYLLTVARNLCRDHIRRSRVRPTMVPEEFVPGGGPGPADACGQAEQMEKLRQAVARLPEGLREVVVLRLSTSLRFEEIAELLHIPLGTALSRMHAAVQALREKLIYVRE
jgi:RNA polymerase sigma-70 factor, ECF subfamily